MPGPDRALRRLIADLAGLHPDDLARVLDDLEPESRANVEALLKEFSREPVAEGSTPEPPPITEVHPIGYDLKAMSPWLAGLLREKSAARNTMTAGALAALEECAAIVHPGGGTKRKKSLFSRRASQPTKQVLA